MTITGYASVFYQPGDDRTQFYLGTNYVERIMPTAFDNALTSGQEVVGLFNHDPSLVLGRRSAGTLRLRTDQTGLHYQIDEADTQVSRDVQEHQQRRDVIGSSFGFLVTEERAIQEKDLMVREIHSVNLRDVGPVTFPAYDGTGDVRFTSLDFHCMEVPEAIALEARSLPVFARFTKIAQRLKQIELDNIRYNWND